MFPLCSQPVPGSDIAKHAEITGVPGVPGLAVARYTNELCSHTKYTTYWEQGEQWERHFHSKA
jgi:hypothetical protein